MFQPTYEEKKEMLFRNKEEANTIQDDIKSFKDMARLLMKEKERIMGKVSQIEGII